MLPKLSKNMASLRNVMNNALDDSLPLLQDLRALQEGTETISVDMYEEGNNVIVKAAIPGIKPEDLDIEVRDNLLIISGEVKKENDRQEKDYHLQERSYGRFKRYVYLPDEVKAEKAEADYQNGILTLTLPIAQSSNRKKIFVKSNITPANTAPMKTAPENTTPAK